MEFQCNQRLHYFGHRNNNPKKKQKNAKITLLLFYLSIQMKNDKNLLLHEQYTTIASVKSKKEKATTAETSWKKAFTLSLSTICMGKNENESVVNPMWCTIQSMHWQILLFFSSLYELYQKQKENYKRCK